MVGDVMIAVGFLMSYVVTGWFSLWPWPNHRMFLFYEWSGYILKSIQYLGTFKDGSIIRSVEFGNTETSRVYGASSLKLHALPPLLLGTVRRLHTPFCT